MIVADFRVKKVSTYHYLLLMTQRHIHIIYTIKPHQTTIRIIIYGYRSEPNITQNIHIRYFIYLQK